MRILADENLDRLMVTSLRKEGHDVFYVAEKSASRKDVELFRFAHAEQRIVITDDLDFGELAEFEAEPPPAIMLLRLDGLGRKARAARIVSIVASLGETMNGHLVVVGPGSVRLRPLSRTPI